MNNNNTDTPVSEPRNSSPKCYDTAVVSARVEWEGSAVTHKVTASSLDYVVEEARWMALPMDTTRFEFRLLRDDRIVSMALVPGSALMHMDSLDVFALLLERRDRAVPVPCP